MMALRVWAGRARLCQPKNSSSISVTLGLLQLAKRRAGAGQEGSGRSPHISLCPPALPSALQQLQGLCQVQSQLPRAERDRVQPGGERECPTPAGQQHPLPHPAPPGPPSHQEQPLSEPIPPNSWSCNGPCAMGRPQGLQHQQYLGSHSPRVLCDPAEVCLGGRVGSAFTLHPNGRSLRMSPAAPALTVLHGAAG